MSRQSRQAEKLDAIRSVSLEDIVHGRHTRWRRFLRRAKPALVGISLFGLTAATGAAVYQTLGGPDQGFPIEDTQSAAEPSAPPPSSGTPFDNAPSAATAPARPAVANASTWASSAEDQAATLAALEPVAPTVLQPPTHQMPEPTEAARLPTPRPEAPIITGSVRRNAAHELPPSHASVRRGPPPRAAETRQFRPCRTLQQLTARLPVPRFRCR